MLAHPRLSIVVTFWGWLALAPALLVGQDFRTWTNREGTPLEAAIQGADATNTTLLLRSNGAKVVVPLAKLSDTDQKWVAEWLKAQRTASQSPNPPPANGDNEAAPLPPALSEWPRTVVLEDKAEVEVIEEDAEKKLFRYESDHYEFICDSRLGIATVREFSRVFESTWLVNCLLPLDLKPSPERLRSKFKAQIYTQGTDYIEAGGVPGSAGIYMSADKALKLPLASLGVKMVGSRVSIDYGSEDYRTLIHEITHQMMNRWLRLLPTWYIEGAAEYVELADYNKGKFSFSQQQSRLKEHLGRFGPDFPMIPPLELMKLTSPEWLRALNSSDVNRNYPSALALTYFFYHLDGDGQGTHLIAWLRELEKMEHPTEELLRQAEATHLLRGRSPSEFESEVKKALRKCGIKVADQK